MYYWRSRARDALETAIRGAGAAGVTAVPILGTPEWLDWAELRRFQWTGILADGKRCHSNKVPCHTDLEKRFAETVDGEFQTYAATDGRFNREHFFNRYPELQSLAAHLSEDDIDRLRRGGHDPVKIFSDYWHAARHEGQPTVILAQPKKGYGMGTAGQGRMTTHHSACRRSGS